MQSPEVENKEAELDVESERMPEEGFEEMDFARASDKAASGLSPGTTRLLPTAYSGAQAKMSQVLALPLGADPSQRRMSTARRFFLLLILTFSSLSFILFL